MTESIVPAKACAALARRFFAKLSEICPSAADRLELSETKSYLARSAQ